MKLLLLSPFAALLGVQRIVFGRQPPLPRRLPDTGEEPAPVEPCGEPQEETLRLPQAAGPVTS